MSDWRDLASCAQVDSELFFPVGTTELAMEQIGDAKRVCRRCEVQDACLQWALDTGQQYGIWGWLTEDERRALKRRAARSRAKELAS